MWPFRKRRPGTAVERYWAYGGIAEDVRSGRDNAFKRELAILEDELEHGVPSAALVAAGQHVLNGQATLLRRLIQPWQIRSYGYYDLIPEIKFAAQFYSRTLSNLRLYIGKRQPDGEIQEVGPIDKNGKREKTTPDDDRAIEALNRIRDPGGGGRSGLLASYGRHMFISGETYLFVTVNHETDREQWEMLSTDEIRLNDGLYTRFKSPSLPARNFMPAPDDQFELVGYDGSNPGASETAKGLGVNTEAIAYRLWRRHPRFSDLADSSMQGVLELCEELLLLTHAVRARARSRLAGSGILFIDDRITTKPLQPLGDEDPLADPFVADLTRAMTTPIVDEGTASAVVPLVARVRVPEGMKLSDLVYHLQIIDPMQVYPETGLRTECIHRMAIGLDMPSDILEGITDANHWTGWLIEEQSWTAYLQPVANGLCEDLTSAYLGPYLKQQGVADWDDYVIWYDASAVINHPDRTTDAKDLHDRGALSDEALRTAAGFDEEDAPSTQEMERWAAIRLRDSSLWAEGIPSLRQGSELEVGPGQIVSPAGNVSATPEQVKGEQKAAVEKTIPDKPESPQQQSEDVVGSLRMDALVSRVEGAAQMGMLRARELAGAKLRSKSHGDQPVLDLIDGVPNHKVAATLGPMLTRQVNGADETSLMLGALSLITDSLRMVGVTDADVAAKLADEIGAQALKSLYEQNPVVNGKFPEYARGLLAGSR